MIKTKECSRWVIRNHTNSKTLVTKGLKLLTNEWWHALDGMYVDFQGQYVCLEV